MARVFAAVAMLSASALLAPGLGAAMTSGSCPVTLPPKGPPPPEVVRFGGADFDYGNAKLRVRLWPNGTLIAGVLPDGASMATIRRDGSISAKLGWWRGQSAELVGRRLVVTGRRLDAFAPRLRAYVPQGYGSLGIQPTGPIFPTVGCWRVTGTQGKVSLSFVVRVTKVKPRKG